IERTDLLPGSLRGRDRQLAADARKGDRGIEARRIHSCPKRLHALQQVAPQLDYRYVTRAQVLFRAIVKWPHALLNRMILGHDTRDSGEVPCLHGLPILHVPVVEVAQLAEARVQPETTPLDVALNVDRVIEVEVHVPGPVAVLVTRYPGMEQYVIALTGPDRYVCVPRHNERRNADVLLAILALTDCR